VVSGPAVAKGITVEVGEEDRVRWRMRCRGGCAEEAAGDGNGAVGAQREGSMAARQSGVDGWARRRREEMRSEHRGTRTGRADRVAEQAMRTGVRGGRRPSVQASSWYHYHMIYLEFVLRMGSLFNSVINPRSLVRYWTI
jgi:hypothetical protein